MFEISPKKFNFQIFLVLIFILAVIIYRTLVQIPLFQNETFRPVAPMVASMTGALVNLVFIMMLGRVYEKLALKLTTWGKNRIIVKNDTFRSIFQPLCYWQCTIFKDLRICRISCTPKKRETLSLRVDFAFFFFQKCIEPNPNSMTI